MPCSNYQIFKVYVLDLAVSFLRVIINRYSNNSTRSFSETTGINFIIVDQAGSTFHCVIFYFFYCIIFNFLFYYCIMKKKMTLKMPWIISFFIPQKVVVWKRKLFNFFFHFRTVVRKRKKVKKFLFGTAVWKVVVWKRNMPLI